MRAAKQNQQSALAPLQGLKWEFAVIDGPQVNAFVVPGGKVVVYTGLMKLLQGPAMETQLAAVLGHEIAHVVARHAVSLQPDCLGRANRSGNPKSCCFWLLFKLLSLLLMSEMF